MKPKAYIIGVGPGASEFLSGRARDRICRSQVVLGWDMDLLPAQDLLDGKEVHLQDVRNYRESATLVAEKFRDTDATVAILRVGDPCISSGLTGLLELFAGYEIEVVPGVSSVQVAASLARINIDEAVVITFHESGNIEERKRFMLDALHRGRHLLMLAGEELRPDAAARYLVEHGIDERLPVLMCERLTLPDETLTWTTLGGLREMQPYWLTVIVVVQPSSTLQTLQGDRHADSVASS
jgi:cobalt-precorrin-7 (C5)-methyltransferase